jgi:hypothetical protein
LNSASAASRAVAPPARAATSAAPASCTSAATPAASDAFACGAGVGWGGWVRGKTFAERRSGCADLHYERAEEIPRVKMPGIESDEKNGRVGEGGGDEACAL